MKYKSPYEGLKRWSLRTPFCESDLFTDENDVVVVTRHIEYLMGKRIKQIQKYRPHWVLTPHGGLGNVLTHEEEK